MKTRRGTFVRSVGALALITLTAVIALPLAARSAVAATIPGSVVDVCVEAAVETPTIRSAEASYASVSVPEQDGCHFVAAMNCGLCIGCVGVFAAPTGPLASLICSGICVSCGGVLMDCYAD